MDDYTPFADFVRNNIGPPLRLPDAVRITHFVQENESREPRVLKQDEGRWSQKANEKPVAEDCKHDCVHHERNGQVTADEPETMCNRSPPLAHLNDSAVCGDT